MKHGPKHAPSEAGSWSTGAPASAARAADLNFVGLARCCCGKDCGPLETAGLQSSGARSDAAHPGHPELMTV